VSDEVNLLAAIRAAPEDDTVRLVYADWLEEQGGLEQRQLAEFIRVQIRLARDPLSSRERYTLARRQEELIDAHASRWIGEALIQEKVLTPLQVGFRRGFVEVVRLSLPRWLNHGERILERHPLRELNLHFSINPDQEVPLLLAGPWPRGLHTLTLHRAHLGYHSQERPMVLSLPGARALAASPRLRQLLMLRLPGLHAIPADARRFLRRAFAGRFSDACVW
jgi:uncharacterized protein (TIGR02996 family)